jgi:hypothetical protein
MTFIVNHDGKIYQADLGPKTSEKASQMQRFDQGKDWTPWRRHSGGLPRARLRFETTTGDTSCKSLQLRSLS